MKKLICSMFLVLACFWSGTANAVLVDPNDNALAPDGFYGLFYGNYYHADEFTGPDGKKAAGADLTATIGLMRLIGYKHLGKLPAAFQVILPFGEVEEKKLFAQKSSGVGDLTFGPGVFLYSSEEAKTHVSYWLYLFAPTGDWDKTKTINLGRNHWSFEHQLAVNTQFNKFIGDMNLNFYHHAKETDNDLHRPQRFELEASLAYQATDRLVVGLNGGGYVDLDEVEVAGADVADTRSRRWQVGPSIGYSMTDRLGVNLRWTKDVSAMNDSKGDDIWLRLSYAF